MREYWKTYRERRKQGLTTPTNPDFYYRATTMEKREDSDRPRRRPLTGAAQRLSAMLKAVREAEKE
jgi:hypothetical protein